MPKSLLMLIFVCGLVLSSITQAAEVRKDELLSSAAGEETPVTDNMVKSSLQKVALSAAVYAPSAIEKPKSEPLLYIVPWQNVIIPKQGTIGPLSGYGPVFI